MKDNKKYAVIVQFDDGFESEPATIHFTDANSKHQAIINVMLYNYYKLEDYENEEERYSEFEKHEDLFNILVLSEDDFKQQNNG